jgi:hypothetical protein
LSRFQIDSSVALCNVVSHAQCVSFDILHIGEGIMGLLKVEDFAGLLVAMLLLFTVLSIGSMSGVGVFCGT